MTKEEILNIFKKTQAMLEGHFLLSSGLHSPKYLQCAKVLQYPRITTEICMELAYKFKELKPDVVVAPALGGVIVSYEVAKALGVRSIFTERISKGIMALRRGFEIKKGEKALIVEDVITTGLSTKEVIEVVKSLGGKVIGVGSIIDRSEEAIDFGVEFKSLLKIDIPTYKPEECPLCKEGTPPVKPGSRK